MTDPDSLGSFEQNDLAAAVKLHLAGDFARAELGYRQLVADGSTTPSVYANLGQICHATRRADEAIALLLQAISLKPDYFQAHYNLGNVYRDHGQLDKAVLAYHQAIRIKPNFADAYSDLGNALKNSGKIDEAVTAFQTAITLKPDYFQAYSNLGTAYQLQGNLTAALESYQRALEIRPDMAEILCNLGNIQKDLDRIDDAIASYRRAIELKPSFHEAYSNLIYCLSSTQLLPQDELLEITRGFEQTLNVKPSAPIFKKKNLSTNTKLSVGFISAEIGDHAVSYFLEAYLRNYARNRIHVTLYTTANRAEAKTAELLALADRSRNLHGVADDMAREQIMADDIDVLVDTTSHTHGGRLALLARRCAPVQCHYIGFYGSTGVSTIDYFIGDDEITPPEFASHFSEKLWRLPRLWVAYTPPAHAPAPEQRSPPGHIVFGSFNNLTKVRDGCLTIWAKALMAVPGSMLILKDRRCADPLTRQRISNALSAKGVDPSRIEFIERVPSWADHMRLYNRIDIALDTCPLNSGTTGFDALIMGTPLVALRGNWMGGRMSSAMVKALGYPQWVAETPEDYVRIITELAADKAALKTYKSTLREQVLRSPLCDGPALAHALDEAFVGMMEKYCSKVR